jgi:NADH dehydrogenase
MSSQPLRHVVIVGAGFGGLAAAKGLAGTPYHVTFVDKHNYHLFQPLLYQVASGLLDPSEIAHPIRSIVRGAPNIEVRMATATGVDVEGRKLHTDSGDIEYDYLIAATGSLTSFFGQDSSAAHALPLKHLEEGLHLRARVLDAFERAAVATDPDERRILMTFAIVGGGPTGVEFAGALSELIFRVLVKDYRNLDFSHVDIVVVEAEDGILGSFDSGLRESAQRALEKKHVRFLFSKKVSGIRADGSLEVDGEEVIPCRTVIWTAGVKAESLAKKLTQAVAAQDRVPVDECLRLEGHGDVFVIGDLAAVKGRDGSVLPMLAPVAIQQGQFVARLLKAQLGGESVEPFRYRDKGTMAAVGRNVAVAQVGPLKLSGLAGWVAWLLVHLLYLVGFRSRLIVLINWGWDYFFYDRPVRLITEAGQMQTQRAADQRKGQY